MSKTKKIAFIVFIILVLLALAALGVVLYIKKNAPPGEEWISYHSGEVTDTIDRQLEGLDAEEIVWEKGSYVIEKSIQEIQEAVRAEKISYEELTAICLYRIKTFDQCEKGYNSVISVNPDAMAEARQKDENRKQNPEIPSDIYGIPVMLKDNINTADMPTSAGAEAFSDFYPSADAGLVKALKDNGAIILGKNNLSEFANYVSNIMPSGYSGSKGQTTNPFGPLKISPSGSSSGSAVAVTANLTPVSIGTETDGSIVAPAAANSTVGFKPSRGSLP
ncbi:amidase family protein [Lachnotalea sp. AF33-28]|jgi:amidase|uniref:amidase family protein n=1 Tax=Lachnotalea sp. AF33-28 TaxID=2292046 RepID=UPI001FAAB26C|nr:amidase family protein [Lachnotalea sp. AF33-28]